MTQEEINLYSVIRVFKSNNVKYTNLGDHIIGVNFSPDGALDDILILITATDVNILFVAFCPMKADKSVYDDVVELITRINCESAGSFTFDYEEGKIAYRVNLFSSDGVPKEQDIILPIVEIKRAYNKYGDTLLKSLLGAGSPKEDLAELEG